MACNQQQAPGEQLTPSNPPSSSAEHSLPHPSDTSEMPNCQSPSDASPLEGGAGLQDPANPPWGFRAASVGLSWLPKYKSGEI
jgi:hypothetical protein